MGLPYDEPQYICFRPVFRTVSSKKDSGFQPTANVGDSLAALIDNGGLEPSVDQPDIRSGAA